jgi:hypothetical protein
MGAYTQLWGGTVASPAQINGQVCFYVIWELVPATLSFSLLVY